ncbi:hypothetical protein YC2023_046537 [Brassica napus]
MLRSPLSHNVAPPTGHMGHVINKRKTKVTKKPTTTNHPSTTTNQIREREKERAKHKIES